MVYEPERHSEEAGALFLYSQAKPTKRSRAPPTKTSRARFACINCRRKKVRCDVQVQGDTCTNCALNKAACQVDLSRESINKEFATNVMDPSKSIMPSLLSPKEGLVHIWEDGDGSIADVPRLKFDAAPNRHELKLDTNSAFPSRELRCHLVHCYLRHVYPSLPIMTVCQLVNIINLQDGEEPSCGWFLLNGFFAASIAFLDESVFRRFGKYSRRGAIQRFISEAKVDREVTFPKYQCVLTWQQAVCHIETSQRTYSAIKALLLMSFCETESPSDRLFWLSLAHAIAVAIQLDNEPSDSPQPEKGLRKRLWWSLFSQLIRLDLTTDIRPRILVSPHTVSALNDEDFETIIPSYLLGELKQLGLLYPHDMRTSAEQNFMNWLDLFRPSHNCLKCYRVHAGCDSTFSAMANLSGCSCSIMG